MIHQNSPDFIEESGAHAFRSQFWSGAVFGLAAVIAALTCRDYAGSWYDGSRLATVEALVDHGTWAIDDTIFVPPIPADGPYLTDQLLAKTGTLDKLYIRGQYYSDKSPVPAVFMAGAYWTFQQLTGLQAASHPRQFCLAMTLISSGVAYIIAVWCMYLLGRRLRLDLSLRLLLTASFGLATLAPVYMQHSNNHILFLGVASPLMLLVVRLARHQSTGNTTGTLIALGTLAGIGYTIDLGVGPVLVLSLAGYIIYRCRSMRALIITGLAAFPWFVLHHTLNYHIGGTFKPANANPDHFLWPGSPFDPSNLTGAWMHSSIGRYLVYLLSMLFAREGFILHNLPLILIFTGSVILLHRRVKECPEIIFALAWTIGTVLLYSAASNNYSGLCYSIRWFVPLLAPCFFILAIAIRDIPWMRSMMTVLSLGGAYLTLWMCIRGPWTNRMPPGFWVVQGLTLLICGWMLLQMWRRKQTSTIVEPTHRRAA